MRVAVQTSCLLALTTMLACGGAVDAPPTEKPPAEAAAEEVDTVTLEGQEWLALSIAGEPSAEGVRSTIRPGEDGRVSGNSGCNQFQGGYEIDGAAITFSPLAGTRMICPEPQQSQEDRFLVAIQAVERFEIIAGVLSLHPAGGGEPTRFSAEPPPDAP